MAHASFYVSDVIWWIKKQVRKASAVNFRMHGGTYIPSSIQKDYIEI